VTGTREAGLTGVELRDAGYDSVIAADEAVHRGHRAAIETALAELIAGGEPFTADDVHRLLGDDFHPHSPSLVSALFGTWRIAGRIRPVGWTTSTRPSRHAAAVRVWTGAQAEGTAA
jgi:hypothetical protein